MLVFGDPQFEERFSTLLARLRNRVCATRSESLDDLRALLIHAGQLEQAVSDAAENANATREKFHSPFDVKRFCETLTDHTANSFHAAYQNQFGAAADFLNLIQKNLLRSNVSLDFPVTIKIPEGYAFYSLFPEQYAISAVRWAEQNSGAKKLLVIGIRSIGTSLSAVVSTALRALGFGTIRFTVRPRGSPFERTATLAENFPDDFRHALVVDEGPGISGSSMVAVAEALLAKGIPRENISFFPGNENSPGSEASNKIRGWWNSTPRYFTPLNQMRWNGKSLEQCLLGKSNELCPRENRFEKIHDATNGLWRNWAYKNERDWPAVNIPFERAKFLCANGSEKILWKFTGLVSEQKPAVFPSEIELPQHLGNFQGFTATQWIDGARFTSRDATPHLLRIIARHLDNVAGNQLASAEIQSGIERLTKMLRRNCEVAFGSETFCQIDFLAKSAREFFSANLDDSICRSYGDGRVAPHEWIRTASGQIFKTDSGAHDTDHTIIGKQPLLWDIAGVIVEWNLDANFTAHFLNEFPATARVDCNTLKFFELSYAAFRMGQSILCAEMNPHDVPERQRLLNAADFYKARILICQFIQSGNLRSEIVNVQNAD